MDKRGLIFACMVNPGPQEVEVVILTASIRDFGGGMAGNPIWAMVPRTTALIGGKTAGDLEELGVKLVPFAIEEGPLVFPLAAKVYAAAAAESLARREEAKLLAWLDSDNIVVREPSAFILPEGKALGYRPVMLRNISSLHGEPPDGFWKMVYEGCGTTDDRIFPMTTTVDGVRIRAHFNAGLLVVRPEWGLLRAWRDNFDRLYQREKFQPFYRQNHLYAVFVHQAVLAGTVLSMLVRSELQELPGSYNYPLMLHDRLDPDKRPRRINELTTLRYDEYQQNPPWLDAIQFEEPQKGWVNLHFGKP